MKLAFTMDDLPLWPQSYPPTGYCAAGIVRSIREALATHGISGVYAFCNSWPLAEHPDCAAILEDWVNDGHHVANHTHAHRQLPDVTADAFIADIAEAERLLAPWLTRAPMRLFRHPLCHWGETQDKLDRVNAYLEAERWIPVDVTSWTYEWAWNRAYLRATEAGDTRAREFVIESFLDFAVAQHRHDHAAAQAWFGEEIVGIALGHNVAFFADVASDYFGKLIEAGVTFVPLSEALRPPVQPAVGSVVSDRFLVLQQKLAAAAGAPTAQIAPEHQDTYARIVQMAQGDRR
ncbi:polysaccharide deacetylase family protein [Cognatishimia sp. F0-27]|uniref:polysaccharide deacetylase family protein n=1 Tax=Cognatishimia sp. F0-27 TaxID=2816855 RepID=UPI001D0C8540|nr:polysaccharide deacetylase family protein [Cognatishimia sp. F0-27]MCC1491052.1 polysaccharide deacetylase family protein [Cognatishimia sp. F0-27]